MEKQIYISEVAAQEGKEALLRGWLYGKRSSGKLQFLIVRDGSGFAQAVLAKAAVPEANSSAPAPPSIDASTASAASTVGLSGRL